MKKSVLYTQIMGTLCLLLLNQQSVVAQSLLDTVAVKAVEIVPEAIINTPYTEYSPVYYKNKVGYVYSSAGREVDKVIKEPYHDVGYAAVDTSGMLALSASFSRSINSPLHEGPFAVHGNKIYFTRVAEVMAKKKKTYTRKIYQGDIYGEAVEPMVFSTDDVSVCHPTLMADGNTMIFAGDLEDTGHMDLYMSSMVDGHWLQPTLLEGDVNTKRHEFFPNLFRDSLLIFASDRPGGYGGYDLYISVNRQDGWSTPELIPTPINSPYDDLGLVLREDAKRGYFTSNRPGGEGKDDIYNLRSLKPLIRKQEKPQTEVEFSVLDKLRFVPVANAQVQITQLVLSQDNLNAEDYNIDLLPGTDEGELLLKLSPKKGKVMPIAYADTDGKYKVKLAQKGNYIVTASAPGYAQTSFVYSVESYGESLDIVLEPAEHTPPPLSTKKISDIRIPTTEGAVVVFENLYYDYNSANIQKGAAVELDALANAMLLNPTMEILLSSHTDARGDTNYNLMLSQERAQAAKQYLMDLGINPVRISTRGYGETEIRNKCKNGVPCTDSEHKYNRRTEVRIVKM